MRWIRYAAVLSLLVLVAGCGESKDRAAEAEKIKQDLTAGFNVMFGRDTLKFVGYDKLEVVPDGDSYKATLSGIKIMPNEPDAPKFGDVTFNVEPKDEDKYSISNLMLPSGVDINLADGQGKARLEIGSQQFSGVWSKTFAGFLDSDAVYKNVTLAADQGVKFAIGEATLKQTSSEKSAGIYDQTGNFALKNITVDTPDGSATIATIASTGDAKGTNLADLVKFRDQFNAVMAASVEDKPVDPAALEALKQMKAFFKDYVSKTEVSSIVLKDTAGQEAFKMDKVTIDGSWLGFDQPKSKFDIDMRFTGISAPVGGRHAGNGDVRPVHPRQVRRRRDHRGCPQRRAVDRFPDHADSAAERSDGDGTGGGRGRNADRAGRADGRQRLQAEWLGVRFPGHQAESGRFGEGGCQRHDGRDRLAQSGSRRLRHHPGHGADVQRRRSLDHGAAGDAEVSFPTAPRTPKASRWIHSLSNWRIPAMSPSMASRSIPWRCRRSRPSPSILGCRRRAGQCAPPVPGKFSTPRAAS